MNPISVLLKTTLLFFFLCPLFMFSQNQNVQQQSDSIQYEFDGTVISRKGNVVVVQQSDTNRLPGENMTGTLSKYFAKMFFGVMTTGWLDVGKMKIKSIENNNVIIMELLEEISVITVNGQKEDHFKPGFIVKFTWKEK